MWVRNSALIVTLYMVVGLVLIVSGFALFSLYRRAMVDSSVLISADATGDSSSMPAPRFSARELQAMYAPGLLLRATERLDQLQATLERTSAMLQQKTALLNQKTAECRALQAELDQTLTFVFELMAAQEKANLPGPPQAGAKPAESVRAQLEAELKSLIAEVQKADFLEQEQARHLEDLKADLAQTEAEVAAMQSDAEAEIRSLSADKAALTSAASQALARTGSAAVPALLGSLADSRAEVRAWAASVLGQIGPDARDAVPLLNTLLNDPAESVRTAAREALARIGPAPSP